MDLKSFRKDKLKMTQEAFAKLIGEEQSNISRWEESGDIPLKALEEIAKKTGTDFNTLLGYQKPTPKPLEVDNSWLKADFTKRTLVDYIRRALENAEIPEEQRKKYVDDLRIGVATSLVKPQIAIVGRSDTGKSTLINALLGADKMPTSWTPTTSIAVYIKHIVDKPAFIEEDVWVFTNHVGDEDLWNECRLYDETYCRQWKIGAGGVEILHSYGTRQGENYNKNAGAAVMFIDAPILNNSDIVDLPGFGTETENDDNITFKAAQRADVIIYLSQANGFMRIEDITYLKRNISELPIWEKKGANSLSPLSNLFVVASQSHTVNNGNREKLEGILDTGCANLLNTLSDEYWHNRQSSSGYTGQYYGKEELRSRFFVYTTDIPDLCTGFNEALKTVLETLPIIINDRTKMFVAEYVKARKPSLINEIEKYEGILAKRDKYVALLGEIDKNEVARVQDNDKRKKEVRDEIHKLNVESINEFSNFCSYTVNTDNLVQLIKERKVNNKKDEVEQFGSWLLSTLQVHCEAVLSNKADKLRSNIENYIKGFSESIVPSFESSSVSVDFDAGRESVLGMFGMNLVAAFVGSLGPALLWGEGLFAITSMLGPIGIIASIVTIGALGVAKLFGGGWEQGVAKKIVAAFEENDITGKFRNGIRDYWTQTEKVFDLTAKELDDKWESYVSDLRVTVTSCDVNEIQEKIAVLKRLSDFFDHIPL
ncbi:hypothetical protein FACS1894216_05190 [Synergistales bacterium]|nr:hypothetical protein FACS1894216_05190 [Synergistales bacterium]